MSSRQTNIADLPEEIVQSTSYQGFPVIRGEFDRTIVGMVSKTELRYACGKLLPSRFNKPSPYLVQPS
jgi:hypothetical protein